jgi:hypothetical protein
MPSVGLLVVHGIGAQRRDWADAFVRRVRVALARRAPDVALAPALAWWAPLTQRLEDALVTRAPRGWRWLRRLVTGYGGDLVAYQAPPHVWNVPGWTYRAVHQRISARLQDVLRGVTGHTGRAPTTAVPLVVVAHSLGSVIFTDFVYDLETGVTPPRGLEGHYRLSLQALFTLGSPLALYGLRYPTRGLDRPITLAPGGTWINAFYRADVIAQPLRAESAAYRAAVREDWLLAARLWPWYWTPLAHLAYWNDRRVIDRVAQQLARAAAAPVA